jgi:hypothetical protein
LPPEWSLWRQSDKLNAHESEIRALGFKQGEDPVEMPDPEIFDFEKFAVGGCCGSPDGIDPDVRCRQCEWEGFRSDFD